MLSFQKFFLYIIWCRVGMFMEKGGRVVLFEATFFGKLICNFVSFDVQVNSNFCYSG